MTQVRGLTSALASVAAGLLVASALAGCEGVTSPVAVCGVTFVQGGPGEPAALHTAHLGRPEADLPPAPPSSRIPPRNLALGVSVVSILVYVGKGCSHGLTVVVTHASRLRTVGLARARDGGIAAIALSPATNAQVHATVYAYSHGRPVGEVKLDFP